MGNEEQERSIALEMGIPLFRRFSEKEAAHLLGVSPATLQRIRFRGEIAYLQISERTIQYFGKHLIEYIMQSEQQKDKAQPKNTITRPSGNHPSKRAILESARRLLNKNT